MVDLHPLEIQVLEVLRKQKRSSVKELAQQAQLELVSASRAAYWLQSKKMVDIDQKTSSFVVLTDRGKMEAAQLPERVLVEQLKSGPKKLHDLKGVDITVALGHAKKRGWVDVNKGIAALLGKPEQLPIERDLSKLLKGPVEPDRLEAIEELKQRGLVEIEDHVETMVEITPEGERTELVQKVTALSDELIRSGAWKNTSFRAYDVSIPAPEIYPARLHPMRLLIEKIRRIFLDMGFIEGVGNFVESAFWDMDALFVPQDHPAREMQDTFYMKIPPLAKLPDKKFVELVAKTHQDGISGSTGWGYEYSAEEAKRTLLRTHTTVVSARNLFKAQPPKKVFCVGKIFRNETLDFKHLMELYQVEGIVFDENVTFRNHLGYLKEFFTRMGFPKARFRPSYYPYTEMSVDVEVFFEPAKAWLELGGSGIFRPEVVVPLTGIEAPVLAWGLGLDRLAMMVYGLDDIRIPYKNDLGWIRSVPFAGGVARANR